MTELIGVVHLPALPGSPTNTLSLAACIEHAVQDARALCAGGADSIIIENFHDFPFRAETVEPHVVASMTAAGIAIRQAVDCSIGINVLRNDARAALAIALACDASFIRVNVHTGAMLTDQGLITGRADETMRLRRHLGIEHVRVMADVLVKHAVPLGPLALEDAVADTVDRGLADAIIITGGATGKPATVDDVARAATATSAPIYVGSGVTADNVAGVRPYAAGIIAGTWLKYDGQITRPVDQERVRQLRHVLDALP